MKIIYIVMSKAKFVISCLRAKNPKHALDRIGVHVHSIDNFNVFAKKYPCNCLE